VLHTLQNAYVGRPCTRVCVWSLTEIFLELQAGEQRATSLGVFLSAFGTIGAFLKGYGASRANMGGGCEGVLWLGAAGVVGGGGRVVGGRGGHHKTTPNRALRCSALTLSFSSTQLLLLRITLVVCCVSSIRTLFSCRGKSPVVLASL